MTKIKRVLVAAGAVLIVFILFVVLFTTRIPTGHTGILTTFGRVEDRVLDSGLMFKTPWQKVVLLDNRIQKQGFTTQAFSSDIQQVDIIGSLSFRINSDTAMDLYRRVGADYFVKLVEPRLWENVKAVFSCYTAEKLVSTRDILSEDIAIRMNRDLHDYSIDVVSVAIENLDFTDVFTDAVEAKQVAEQQKLRATTEQQQKTMEAQQAAERQRIDAQAQADVRRIEADARAYATSTQAAAEAEANQKVASSLTDRFVEYHRINKWDGMLPAITSGSNTPLIVDTTSMFRASAEDQ